MKKIFIILMFFAIFVFTKSGDCKDLNQFQLKVGQKYWVNSGHTFKYSDVTDKEFNEECYEVQYIRTIEDTSLRWYFYIGRDDVLGIEIYDKWYFMYDIRFIGAGMKYVFYASKNIESYFGIGMNYTSMWLDYNKEKEEKLSNYGPDISLGISTPGRVFVDLNVRYSINRMASKIYTKTSWAPVGLKSYFGLGFRW